MGDRTHALLILDEPAPTGNYTLSLHDALPILPPNTPPQAAAAAQADADHEPAASKPSVFNPYYGTDAPPAATKGDRKSTRLNSSHVESSYAVFCLKKKKLDRASQTCGQLT